MRAGEDELDQVYERCDISVTEPHLAPLVHLVEFVLVEFLRPADGFALFAAPFDHLVGALLGEIRPELIKRPLDLQQ